MNLGPTITLEHEQFRDESYKDKDLGKRNQKWQNVYGKHFCYGNFVIVVTVVVVVLLMPFTHFWAAAP